MLVKNQLVRINGEPTFTSFDALEAELAVPADTDDHRKLMTESALLNNALVLYVRATKTESKERGGFDLRAITLQMVKGLGCEGVVKPGRVID